MRKIVPTLALFLTLAGLGSRPARADWFEDVTKEIEDIGTAVSSVGSKVSAVSGQVAAVAALTKDVPAVFTALVDSRGDLADGTALRGLVTLAQSEMKQLVQSEAQHLTAFVNGTGPAEIRALLKGFVTDLRDVTNAQLSLMFGVDVPCVGPVAPQVTFERLLEAIDNAPATALYPIHRAQDLLAQLGSMRPLLQCLRHELVENLEFLIDALDDDIPDRVLVDTPEKASKLRAIRKVVDLATGAMQVVGALVQSASKSLDVGFEAALWGWVGFSVDADTAEAIGKFIEKAAPPLRWVSQRLTRRIDKAELAAYQAAVIANQQLIVDLLTTPGQGVGQGAGR